MALSDPHEVLALARNLMREGQVQQADNLITDYFRAAAAGGAAIPEGAAPPKPERPPLHVVHDILAELVGLLGNKQVLQDLLTELRAVL